MLFDQYKILGHRFKKRRLLSNVKAYFFQWRLVQHECIVKPNTLLIVRVDRIGDYVLFRDFLRTIRQSERYKSYHITLCGNQAFRDIAENYDADVIDDYIWLDRSRFMKNKNEHFCVLHTIRMRGFETVVQPTFSRDIFGDLIVRASNAQNRIGVNGDYSNQKLERRKITDTFYTELIDVDSEPTFEFNRNKEVVEKFLGHSINIEKPTWPASKKTNLVNEKNYTVFIIGAGDKRKRWDKFGEIADFVFKKFGSKIVFVGKGKSDRKAVHQIIQNARFDFLNLCDQISLSQVGSLFEKSKLVVGNDSGLIHIASLLNVPTVCVSPGAHAFRFNYYPASFDFKTTFLFPPELERIKNTDEFKSYSSRYAESYNVRSISAERVKSAIRDVLSHE